MWRILAFVLLITFIVLVISQMVLPIFSSKLEPFWLFRPARKNNGNKGGQKQPEEIDITAAPIKNSEPDSKGAAASRTMVIQNAEVKIYHAELKKDQDKTPE